MGKIALQSLLAILFLLISSCISVAITTQTTTIPSSTPTATPTVLWTRKPMPTITPSPTPTSYPTFDLSSVVTSTPFPPAECPPEDPEFDVVNDFDPENDPYMRIFELIEESLAAGASLRQVSEAFDLEMMDLTGDGVAELVYNDFTALHVVGCTGGEITEMLEFIDSASWVLGPTVHSVQDMNLNGIPEVVTDNLTTTGLNETVNIFEWDGTGFIPLLRADHGIGADHTSAIARSLYWFDLRSWLGQEEEYMDYGEVFSPSMESRALILVEDTDGNGSLELLLKDWGPASFDANNSFGPWRGKQVTFSWDGLHFLLTSLEMDPPEFRFQAVQDADRFFLIGDYEKALFWYREAIFSDELDWFTEEMMEFQSGGAFGEFGDDTSGPDPDPNEYPALAAYSRYRIMLYWLTGGWVDDAQIVYETLLQEYPEGTAGYPYAEMASILWNSYQETGDLVAACQPVVTFVEEHEEILDPLEGMGTSMQSHIYEPFDVCPFTWLSQIPNP